MKETDVIKTEIGMNLTVDKDALDDMEVFEDLMKMEDPEENEAVRTRSLNRVFQRLIGPEQDKALREYLRAKDGKVKISAYQGVLKDVFLKMNESKKN